MGNCHSGNRSVGSTSESKGRSKHTKSTVRSDGKPAHAVQKFPTSFLPPINPKKVNQKAEKGGDATLSRKRKNSISSTPDAEVQYLQDPTNVGVKENTPGMQYHKGNPGKRETTASSILLEERKLQEKNVSAQRRRCKSQGETDDGRELSPRQEEKEQKEIPATRNDSENYTSRSNGTSKWNQPINDPGPSHIRNEENEEERNRVLKAESCTENLQTKPILKGKKKRKRQELEALVKELTEEKNKLLNRLSEIGAMQLTENNPNITDLSDANRPEKLVEQFAELYDNEWTDAYEDLTRTQGKQLVRSVELLLNLLKEAYSTCLISTKERATTLRKAMLSYAGLSDKDSSELELKEIEKKMREYRTKKSQCNVTRVQEEVKQKFNDQTKISNTLSVYIDGCVRICWFMCIMNPPMHLDFDEREETTTTDNNTVVTRQFDKSKFVSYTKSGDYIDYVVWPAVYLDKGGPIMRKGVAQGFQYITDTLVDVKL